MGPSAQTPASHPIPVTCCAGLPTPAHAARVARRLFEPDVFTGWGLRTLSSLNPAYNILFEVRNPDHHHDGIRLRNGNVLLACFAVLPADLAAQVQGGVAGTEYAWGMDGDYVQEVTTDGQLVWEWRSWGFS